MVPTAEPVRPSVSQFTSIAAEALCHCKDVALREAIEDIRDPLVRVASSGNHDGRRHVHEGKLFSAAIALYDAYLNSRPTQVETAIVRRALEVVLSEFQSPPYREGITARLHGILASKA